MKLSLAIIALVWLGLGLAGLPLPMCDDLFFFGAALNLVHGGGLANPYCPGVERFGATEHFFVYPPFSFYAMAAWLKVFGVSRAALASYIGVAGAMASWGLFAFINPGGSRLRQIGFALAICLAVALFANALGLRPDMLGLALFVWGLHLVRARTPWALSGCSLLLFLSGLTSPNFGLLVPLVFIYAVLHPAGDNLVLARVRVLIAAGGAGLLALGMFLLMIGGQVGTFVTIFNQARQNTTYYALLPQWGLLRFVLKTVIPIGLALAVPVLGLLVRRHYTRPIPLPGLVLFLVASGIVSLLFFQSGAGIAMQMLVMLVLGLYYLARLPARELWLGGALLAGLYLFSIFNAGRFSVQLALMSRTPRTDEVTRFRALADAHSPGLVLIDSGAAARLYDYRLPPNVRDNYFGIPGVWARFAKAKDFPPGSLIIVAAQTAVQYRYQDSLNPDIARALTPLPVLGRFYQTLDADPYKLIAIPIDSRLAPDSSLPNLQGPQQSGD